MKQKYNMAQNLITRNQSLIIPVAFSSPLVIKMKSMPIKSTAAE